MLGSCSNAQPVVEDWGDLELSGYELSFSEEFDGPLDVSNWGCNTKWIAHTPWAGDFGAAAFSEPRLGFPFTISDGILAIEARRAEDGSWWSGLLASWDKCGSGAAAQYGYFESRLRVPKDPGFWPAFWLIGVVSEPHGTAEIDVFEHYTVNTGSFSTGFHKHPGSDGSPKISDGLTYTIPDGTRLSDFHLYGVLIDEKEMVMYFDRKEIWRAPMPPEFRQPMYPLIDLAVVANDISADTPDRAKMFVDYVRIYQKPW